MSTEKTKQWYAGRAGNNYQGLVIDETTGRTIAVTYDRKDTPLIAAAPALLRVCKAYADFCMGGDIPREIQDAAYAAITDAEEEMK